MEKINRKDFLKISACCAAGAFSGIIFSGTPLRLLKELGRDEEYAPAVLNFVESNCLACAEKCDITVKISGVRAVKIESANPLCHIGRSAPQFFYHPERILTPMKVSAEKGSGKFSPVSWQEAISAVSGKMNALISDNKADSIAAINSSRASSAGLLEGLLASAGSPHSYSEGCGETSALNGIMNYNFDKAGCIVSFGAPLFDAPKEPALNRFLKNRTRDQKIIYIGTNCDRTASIADEWIPVKPGTERVFAMAMADYIFKKYRKIPAAPNAREWLSLASQLGIDSAAAITGANEEKTAAVAETFYLAKNPLAVTWNRASSIDLAAVYCLNSMLRSPAIYLRADKGNSKKFSGLDAFIREASFEMLFINEANPVYSSVFGKELSQKAAAAFTVAISPFINDSALYADYILPPFSNMEQLTSGGHTVVTPLGDAMNSARIIFSIAENIPSAALPYKDYNEYINNKTRMTLFPANYLSFNTAHIQIQIDALKNVEPDPEYPLSLVYIPTGLTAFDSLELPYVSKAIDKNIFENGIMKVHINSVTADKYSLSEGSKISLVSKRGESGPFKVHIANTVAPDVVAAPDGFGHRGCTKYADKKGINLKNIMSADIDPLTGEACAQFTPVKIV
ncbi:MAG: molybdopterin-dependent oxidoreductase [Leptospirales bacterium]|nr:molybdopterin-dependent oxidoreductase [Leptospirales bacterium]